MNRVNFEHRQIEEYLILVYCLRNEDIFNNFLFIKNYYEDNYLKIY